ncbi:MAG: tetratricopeptide repeat protein [Xanthomonadales bacterium]|nr:tetratricopeptide repeat protein [Xanthomonadales bacterium]
MRHLTLKHAALALLLIAPAGFCTDSNETPKPPPLYDNLGDHHVEISTEVPKAQAYFDQGMRLYYAFNHAEAVRAFREAQRLDPDCAICWWGEALAYGPNINLPMDEPSALAAYAALQGALERREHANEFEQALIDALATRYVAEPPEDRAHLDQAYSDAMAKVAAKYPGNHEARVLYAESLMDLRPWDYWAEDGTPNPGIQDALDNLAVVIEADEKHPGACHFWIHAVEKLYPERAVECAERLAGLMPGAGHLVHMPGHIYIRVGRYHDAVEANHHAIHADETYIADQNPAMGMYTAGYYPHNYDFLAFASMMIGQSKESISSAEKVAALLPQDLFGAPGMDFLQHWSVRPLFYRVRFERWDEILAAPKPADNLPHAVAMWHYARGRALAANGTVEAAEQELAAMQEIAASEVIEGVRMEFNESPDLLGVGVKVLEGWVHTAAGRYDQAQAALEEAVAREDKLLYGEPPEWTVPARQDLGYAMLEAGRSQVAEQAFREELEHFPANGWSLYGLAQALKGQGRDEEAEAVMEDFEEAWRTADTDVLAMN